jgi:hypothetical protein
MREQGHIISDDQLSQDSYKLRKLEKWHNLPSKLFINIIYICMYCKVSFLQLS